MGLFKSKRREEENPVSTEAQAMMPEDSAASNPPTKDNEEYARQETLRTCTHVVSARKGTIIREESREGPGGTIYTYEYFTDLYCEPCRRKTRHSLVYTIPLTNQGGFDRATAAKYDVKTSCMMCTHKARRGSVADFYVYGPTAHMTTTQTEQTVDAFDNFAEYRRKTEISALTDQGELAARALSDLSQDACLLAVERLMDQTLLADVVRKSKNNYVRIKAAEKLDDRVLAQKVFSDIAVTSYKSWERIRAIVNLSDQELLAKIALDKTERDVRLAAIRRLTSQDTLARIAERDKNNSIRAEAAERLAELRIQ